jgi:hypothetical protein
MIESTRNVEKQAVLACVVFETERKSFKDVARFGSGMRSERIVSQNKNISLNWC